MSDNAFVVAFFDLVTNRYSCESIGVVPMDVSEKRDWCMSSKIKQKVFDCPRVKLMNSKQIENEVGFMLRSFDYFFVRDSTTFEILTERFEIDSERILFLKKKIQPMRNFFCLSCYLSPFSSHNCVLHTVLTFGNHLKNVNPENFPLDMILPCKDEVVTIPLDVHERDQYDTTFERSLNIDTCSETSTIFERVVQWK
jgi:hypothetical protein